MGNLRALVLITRCCINPSKHLPTHFDDRIYSFYQSSNLLVELVAFPSYRNKINPEYQSKGTIQHIFIL